MCDDKVAYQHRYAFPHQHLGLHKGSRTGVRGLHILDISIRIGFPLPVFHFLRFLPRVHYFPTAIILGYSKPSKEEPNMVNGIAVEMTPPGTFRKAFENRHGKQDIVLTEIKIFQSFC